MLCSLTEACSMFAKIMDAMHLVVYKFFFGKDLTAAGKLKTPLIHTNPK